MNLESTIRNVNVANVALIIVETMEKIEQTKRMDKNSKKYFNRNENT